MVSQINYTYVAVFSGLSGDTKPTDCPNGSIFIEIDTSDVYMFDAENGIWIAW